MSARRPALEGVKVLDFSTLLPGPLASLVLAEAGAEVIKVERAGEGDELRVYPPPFGGWGFVLLNRGKKSLALNLKDPAARRRLEPLLAEADILIEQFRPGVMARLGLDHESVARLNPRIVYCSITGYGQDGPKAAKAGHDLNYQAESGLLSLGGDKEGAPVIAPGLMADIGGGTLPALVNILLALRMAERDGQGAALDIAMTDNLFAWAWWALAARAGGTPVKGAGRDLLTGGSPRYRLYRTRDGRFLAVAALEERFWQRLCDCLEIAPGQRDDARDPEAAAQALEAAIAALGSKALETLLAGEDTCCSLVASLEEALGDPHFHARGLFQARTAWQGKESPALPVPLAPALRAAPGLRTAPGLGEGQED